MRLGKDLLDKPVYGINDGRLLGAVSDIYLDAGLTQMSGIYLGSTGLIRRQAQLIPDEEVSVFGIDAIFVSNSDVLTTDKELSRAQEWVLRKSVIGRSVNTGGGTKVGIVGDILFLADGTIAAFTLSRTFIDGPIADKRMIPVEVISDLGLATKIITVDLAAAEKAVQHLK